MTFDVERLLSASGWPRYHTLRGKTRYGALNVPTGSKLFCGCPELLLYLFSEDKNGNISVNVKKYPRKLDNDTINSQPDYRGFIIERKTGKARKLVLSKSNKYERDNPRKAENWFHYESFLMRYMKTLGGEEE
jgi:hypothetical protein